MSLLELPALPAHNPALCGVARASVIDIKSAKVSLGEGSSLLVKMNPNRPSPVHVTSSASSTSKSHSSGGLLIKRSKTSNNLGTVFEQKKTTVFPNRRISRDTNQKLSNRSEYGSTIGTSKQSTVPPSRLLISRRSSSTNDISKLDGNNNFCRNISSRGQASKQDKRTNKTSSNKPSAKPEPEEQSALKSCNLGAAAADDVDDEEAENLEKKDRTNRIMEWLQIVEKFAEPPPEVTIVHDDDLKNKTDTAIHIVYKDTSS